MRKNSKHEKYVETDFLLVRAGMREWGVEISEEGRVSPLNQSRIGCYIRDCKAFVVIPGGRRNVAYMVIDADDFEIATGPIRGNDAIFAVQMWAEDFNRVASGESKVRAHL